MARLLTKWRKLLLLVVTASVAVAMVATTSTILESTLSLSLGTPHASKTVIVGSAITGSSHPGPVATPLASALKDPRAIPEGDLSEWRISMSELRTGNESAPVFVIETDGDFFSAFGFRPVLGRLFTHEERQYARPVAIISNQLWRSEFEANPAILGRELKIGNRSVTVVGVAQPGAVVPFASPSPTIWIPASFGSSLDRSPTRGVFLAVTLSNLAIAKKLPKQLASVAADIGLAQRASDFRVETFRSYFTGDALAGLWAIESGVLMAYATLCFAMMSLAGVEALGSQHELVTLIALGAPRNALLRRVTSGAFVCSIASFILGTTIAWSILSFCGPVLSSFLSFSTYLRPDRWTILFAALTALVPVGINVIVYLAFISGIDPARVLRSSGPSHLAGESRLVLVGQRLLGVVQLAVSMALIASTATIALTIRQYSGQQLGFNPAHLLVVGFPLAPPSGNSISAPKQVINNIIRRLSQIPGSSQVAFATALPLNPHSSFTMPVRIKGDTETSTTSTTQVRLVSWNYYKTLGIPVIAGRTFTPSDESDGQISVVVNRVFAESFLGGVAQAPGKAIQISGVEPRKYATVMGVVSDTPQASIMDASRPEVDVLYNQIRPTDALSIFLAAPSQVAIRTSGPPMTLASTASRIITSADQGRPAYGITTMEQIKQKQTRPERMTMLILLACAGSTGLVALLALVSLLRLQLLNREHGLRIRFAIGASRRHIWNAASTEARWTISGGILLGVCLSILAGRILTHYTPTPISSLCDGTIIAGVVLGLVAGTSAVFTIAGRLNFDSSTLFKQN